MKNVIKGLGLSAIMSVGLLGGAPANAAVTCSAAGLNCVGPANEVITGIFPADAGFILLTVPQAPTGIGCTGSSGGANVKLEGSHGLFKETYAAVLTAAALNSNITLRVEAGGGAECVVAYVRIDN